jgi:hypothetical protein
MEASTLPSVEDIESKMTEITAKLTARGTTTGMMEWTSEYKKLDAELKAAKDIREDATKSVAAQMPS